MFMNFWYPAEESKNLNDKPLKVQMLGLHFALWRDSQGKAHCVHNTCTHRGGSLGDGKVVGDCIQCPYHGWKFNGAGDCERIPSLGALDKIPQRARIDAYPVEERYGLVFVFLGDLPESERPTIMPNNEYGQPGWRSLSLRYRWQTNYVRLVENQSDPSHIEYVHAGFGMAGKSTNYEVPKINVEESAWGAGAMVVFYSPELPDPAMKHMQPEGRNESGSGYHGVASTWTRVNFSPTNHMHIYLYAVPRDELDLEIFLVMQRDCMLEEKFDENFLKRMAIAVEEDRIVIEKLDPQIPSTEAIGEFIVPADDVIMSYRRRLQDWERRGWRLDCGTLQKNRGRVAYAIPSPARRGSPAQSGQAWAVTAAPVVRPAALERAGVVR
jgi:phenylpropionate dioxygenase-like ring-hydroxylating dioxygenase large terminal subunit